MDNSWLKRAFTILSERDRKLDKQIVMAMQNASDHLRSTTVNIARLRIGVVGMTSLLVANLILSLVKEGPNGILKIALLPIVPFTIAIIAAISWLVIKRSNTVAGIAIGELGETRPDLITYMARYEGPGPGALLAPWIRTRQRRIPRQTRTGWRRYIR